MRAIPIVALAVLALAPIGAEAQQPGAATATPGPAPGALVPSFGVRARLEAWDWFDAPDAPDSAGRYAFVGATVRAGLAQQLARWGWRVELAAPVLLGLPDDAVAAAPRGQLGLGASYWGANDGRESVASLFPKQAFVRIGRAPAAGGHALRIGRFEFSEGAETTPAQPTVAAVKRDRVAQRLVGAFGWSHVGRSLDGAQYTFGRRGANVTAVLARPTQGVFRADGWAEVADVTLGYGAVTVPLLARDGAADARLFAVWYDDRRFDGRAELVAVDNRPLATRRADREGITVTTVGGHLVDLWASPGAELDLLLWGALQGGSWGAQSHRAGALAIEGGVQPTGVPWRPWLRASWFRSSGDGDPADDRHGTFFQLLPTPRPYARMPFFNLMNLQEVAGSLLLRPSARATLRADARGLRLSEAADLWYSGGGAFETRSFGYAGRPSNGARPLATLLDLSIEVRATPRLTVTAYGAQARGGAVVERIYPADARGRFAYLELEWRR